MREPPDGVKENKKLVAGQNKFLFAGTVPANNLFHKVIEDTQRLLSKILGVSWFFPYWNGYCFEVAKK